MKLALTGATGLVGRAILTEARARGALVTALGRSRPDETGTFVPWSLETTPEPGALMGQDVLIHCAFSHVPGRYRGGEGDDPEGFLRRNLDGTRRLFDAAASAGVPRIVFLSSRAVFDAYPPGTDLPEDLPPNAASLYGETKLAAETHLDALALSGLSIRSTGVYTDATDNKWSPLFKDFLAGRDVAPRRGTEVSGHDLAQALFLALEAGVTGAIHVSDFVLDRHDLLAEVARIANSACEPPPRSDAALSPLLCDTLTRLGWKPGGWARLCARLPDMLDVATGAGPVRPRSGPGQ